MKRIALLALVAAACTRAPPPAADAGAPPPPVVSEEVLARPVDGTRALIRHVLIGWRDLQPNYQLVPMDPRALQRDRAQAAARAREVLEKARGGTPFDQLMRDYSEDLGSATTGEPYEVRPDGQFESGFQALALRLKPGEVGVCETAYGFHVIKRLE